MELGRGGEGKGGREVGKGEVDQPQAQCLPRISENVPLKRSHTRHGRNQCAPSRAFTHLIHGHGASYKRRRSRWGLSSSASGHPPGCSGAMAVAAEVQVTARGITLSSTSVPATICSIPICMRREAHYVAALMWEEGAGERRGGEGGGQG